jgi:hypothetical protein
MERNEIETALDAGRISVRMRNGKFWKVRRNGVTKTWIRKPNEFRIPVKFGFRGHDAITHCDEVEMFGHGNNNGYVIDAESK